MTFDDLIGGILHVLLVRYDDPLPFFVVGIEDEKRAIIRVDFLDEPTDEQLMHAQCALWTERAFMTLDIRISPPMSSAEQRAWMRERAAQLEDPDEVTERALRARIEDLDRRHMRATSPQARRRIEGMIADANKEIESLRSKSKVVDIAYGEWLRARKGKR